MAAQKNLFSVAVSREKHFASLRIRNSMTTMHDTPNIFSIAFKINDLSCISMRGFNERGINGMIIYGNSCRTKSANPNAKNPI